MERSSIRCYFKSAEGQLACVDAGNAFDHEDAIKFVTESLVENDEKIKSPVLAVIQGGKK